MFRHYVQSIYINFKQDKGSFFINLIGLSVGLTCTILIFLWVNSETRIDRFHLNDGKLYQVMENQQVSGNIETTGETSAFLARALKQEIPEIEYAVSSSLPSWFPKFTMFRGENAINGIGIYGDEDYFKVFSYNLIEGDESQVLKNKNSIVISEDLAKSLFNKSSNVLGKAVEFKNGQIYNVSGVFMGTPINSTMQFDFVLPYEILLDMVPQFKDWGNTGPATYVVLKEGSKLDAVNSKISNFMSKKVENSNRTLFLRPYSDGYLYNEYENGEQIGGRIEYVNLFSIIAIFILLIACINFMNLSTAKASRKIKEVGIKKAIGASRKSLIYRYLGESIAITIFSLLIAILLAYILLPQFNDITGKEIVLEFNAGFILFLFAIVIFTGFVSGSYPALYLSGFDPISVLKGQMKTSTNELLIRKGLVFLQFAISIIFIVSVLVIYSQIDLLQTKNLGYDRENLVYFDAEGKVKESMETYLSEVEKIPGVINTSSLRGNFLGNDGTTVDISWEGKSPDNIIKFKVQAANYDLIETLGIKMKSGHTFSRRFGSNAEKVILNESAVSAMGFKDDPVGKTIKLHDKIMDVIGVANDFHYESLHEGIKPLVFLFSPEKANTAMIRLQKGEEHQAMDKIKALTKQYDSRYVLDYKFLDSEYQIQYVSEKRVGVLSRYFSILAIIISCLGLFGLAAFTAERRKKEIGLRKALGSSQRSIVYLLSLNFTKIVALAILVSLPLSYFLVTNWLQGFAYRIDLKLWYFALSGLIALLISWVVVGLQSYRASGVDPIECLRTE